MAVAVVDTGPLLAVATEGDRYQESCFDVLSRTDLQLVVPALVVAETTYLIGSRLGPRREAVFLRGLESFDVAAPEPEDWQRIGSLVEQYVDLPLGGIDASLIALAERLDARTLITLDRRHFSVVRPRHCEAFALLPE